MRRKEHRVIDGVEKKWCKHCELWKAVNEFYNSRSRTFDGLDPRCKSCISIQQKERVSSNKGEYLKRWRNYNRKWRTENHERTKELARALRKKYPERSRAYCKKWVENNPEKAKERYKKYHVEHREEEKMKRKTHTNLVRAKMRKIRYKLKSREKYLASVKRQNQRRALDPRYRLSRSLSAGINAALNGRKNRKHWETLVGYTLNDLSKHLEKQFKEGMSWRNYGNAGWHIDHKIPICVFNFEKYEDLDFKRCWALENLQPLWAEENIKKQAKLSKPFQPALKIAV